MVGAVAARRSVEGGEGEGRLKVGEAAKWWYGASPSSRCAQVPYVPLAVPTGVVVIYVFSFLLPPARVAGRTRHRRGG